MVCIALCAISAAAFACLIIEGSPSLSWDQSDLESAFLAMGYHIFEWIFIRVAPLLFIGGLVGAILTRKRS